MKSNSQRTGSAAAQNRKIGCSHQPCLNDRMDKRDRVFGRGGLNKAVADAHAAFFARRRIAISTLC